MLQYIIPFVTAIVLIILVLGLFFLFQTNPNVATFITRQWAIVTMVVLIIVLLLTFYLSQSKALDLQMHSPLMNPNLPTLYEVHVTQIYPDSHKWKFDTSFHDDKQFIKDVARNKINLILANGIFYKPSYASQDTLLIAPSNKDQNASNSNLFSDTILQIPAVMHILGWHGQ